MDGAVKEPLESLGPGATKRDFGGKSWALCNPTKGAIKLTYNPTVERRQYIFSNLSF